MKKFIILGLILCANLAMSIESSRVSQDEQKEQEQEQVVTADEENTQEQDEGKNQSLWSKLKEFIRTTFRKDVAPCAEETSSDGSQNLDEQQSDVPVDQVQPEPKCIQQEDADSLQQIAPRKLSLEEILSSPDEIKKLTVEEIATLNFATVSPKFFLELSQESIMALLEKIELLAKFSEKQWDCLISNIIEKLNFEEYDDLWQRLELNIHFIVTKTNFFNRFNDIDIQKVTPLVFQKMLPQVFKKLSPEKISQLSASQLQVLSKEQFDVLDTTQVQAINSQQLSKALKNKLLQPLDISFVEKLSLEQIRTLLGNHIGFRFKNWVTMFKDNFTSDALKYIKDRKDEDDALRLVESFDSVFLNDLDLHKLKKITKHLSEKTKEKIVYAFQEKQNIRQDLLLGQFKKISIASPARLAQRILWTKASAVILVKLPAAYQKVEVALGLKTKEQVSKLNEIFNNIKNNSSHFISPEVVKSLKVSESDKDYIMQRVKDFNEVFRIGIKIDPKIKELKRKI